MTTTKLHFQTEDDGFDPFAGPTILRTAPSTESQRELWTACRMSEEASLAFNESAVLTLEGTLDETALEGALNDLVARHEALRATFTPDGLTICIGEAVPAELAKDDLSGAAVTEQQRELGARLAREVEEPFSLESGPLIRFRLIRLSEGLHKLVLTGHHIVNDGWSLGVIVRDLGALYTRRVGGSPELPEPERFSDYARAEAEIIGSPEWARAEAYWLRRFDGALPTLELPSDRPRPPLKTFSSLREDFSLSGELVQQLKNTGAKAGASFFVTLFTGFQVLLHRLTGQDDLVLGTAAAGQALGHRHLVGHCVNTLPIRAQLNAEMSFKELAADTRTHVMDGFEHQRYTFGALLRKLSIPRDPSRLPLVSVLFNLDQAVSSSELEFGPLQVSLATNARRYENFDLFVNAVEDRGRLVLEVQYNTDLFEAATIRRWFACYEVLLRAVVSDPAGKVGSLPILSQTERGQLLEWNATSRDYPRDRCIDELIWKQATQTPDAIAVEQRGQTLTYRELARQADALAAVLRSKGVQRGTLVGLCVERTPRLVVAVLAILRAGGAYVPLDPNFPAERLAFMIEDSRMPVLVAEPRLEAVLPEYTGAIVWLEGELESLAAAPETSSARPHPESTAYVIYTSGSTGKPKGVQVPHRAVVNFLSSMQETPGLNPSDRLLAVTTLSFDISVLELLLPLVTGACVVIADKETAADGQALAGLLATGNITLMQATPATWQMLLASGWIGSKTLKVLCGGEALSLPLAQSLVERCQSVWNMYGPTETTVWSTVKQVTAPVERISIGRPIANTQVHILDARLNPTPIGVPGELYIGGDGVTLGYLARPELNEERFIDDPYRPGHRMYKTGDLARYRPDGELEYLGRNDFQVKIRGYRIELGEIEAVLVSTPPITEAVVTAREDQPGDVRLVAYLISSSGELDEQVVRSQLRAKLPDYMVPQHYLVLAEMPRLPNGKVDRKRLPAPAETVRGVAGEAQAPRSELEATLLALFEQKLHARGLGVFDDFFANGGHSLLAAQCIAQLNHDLGVSLPMRALFQAPTVAALAEYIDNERERGEQKGPPPIASRSQQDSAPLSLMQQRVWFLEQLHPQNVMFNTPAAHRLRGPLDETALEGAFQDMVRRQPSLRTVVRMDRGAPMQIVLPDVPVSLLPMEDLSALDTGDRERELRERIREMTLAPFDFAKGPLFRVRLFKLAPEEHAFVFVVHHIIWDGWSFDLFHDEISELYEARRLGRSPELPELPVSYGDFAVWQREWLQGEVLEGQVSHWKAHLEGHSEPLDLPADRQRPPEASGTGITEWIELPRETTDALRALGQQCGATLFMTLLAAFYVFLWRLSRQSDLVVGTPVRGRSHAEVERLMGFFVNALAVRQQLNPAKAFGDLVREVRETVLDAFGHPDVPFEHLVREMKVPRDASRFPIYQAFFSFQDARQRPTAWGNLAHERIPVHQAGIAEDISIWFVERSWGLIGAVLLNADVFDEVSARRFRDRFLALLESILAEPSRPIAALSLIPEAERREIAALNPNRVDRAGAGTLAQLFEAQVDRVPDRVAVRFGATAVTYRQLDTRANQLAWVLRDRGVQSGSLVGLCLGRSVEMLVAVLAVLKAGGAYLPLDPKFPTQRLSYQIEDSDLLLVVSEAALQSRHGCPPERTLNIDELAGERADQSGRLPAEHSAKPSDIAYVLYTSGSTGRPKGVRIPHSAAVNFLDSMRQTPGLSEHDRLVAVTTLSFDISVLELLLPLSVGAEVVLASDDQTVDGPELRNLLESSGATVMQATPVTWRFLIQSGWRGGQHFKALCGGEALPIDLAQALLERTGELWNMYGPTETTVWSTCWRVDNPEAGIFVGRPIANTTVRVLDSDLNECPIGVPGEIYIGGAGLAAGYLNRPELTQERFIADPLALEAGQKLYKTGDLGRWREGGLLECLGRTDFQVKVRGHRIELGEIEACLAGHESVSESVVIVREDKPGDVRIVAYVIPRDGRVDGAALRLHLRATLPDYMVPQNFVELDAFPTTPNGKIDRKRLPSPAAMTLAPSAQSDAPGEALTPTEAVLADVWKAILGVSHVRRSDNFFDLGGHSLSAMEAIAELEKRLGKRLGPREFIFNTLGQIAASYGSSAPAPVADPPDTAGQPGLLRKVMSVLRRT